MEYHVNLFILDQKGSHRLLVFGSTQRPTETKRDFMFCDMKTILNKRRFGDIVFIAPGAAPEDVAEIYGRGARILTDHQVQVVYSAVTSPNRNRRRWLVMDGENQLFHI